MGEARYDVQWGAYLVAHVVSYSVFHPFGFLCLVSHHFEVAVLACYFFQVSVPVFYHQSQTYDYYKCHGGDEREHHVCHLVFLRLASDFCYLDIVFNLVKVVYHHFVADRILELHVFFKRVVCRGQVARHLVYLVFHLVAVYVCHHIGLLQCFVVLAACGVVCHPYVCDVSLAEFRTVLFFQAHVVVVFLFHRHPVFVEKLGYDLEAHYVAVFVFHPFRIYQ